MLAVVVAVVIVVVAVEEVAVVMDVVVMATEATAVVVVMEEVTEKDVAAGEWVKLRDVDTKEVDTRGFDFPILERFFADERGLLIAPKVFGSTCEEEQGGTDFVSTGGTVLLGEA